MSVREPNPTQPADPLSEQLRLLGVDLDRNAANYDEMQDGAFTPEELVDVAKVKTHLRKVPVVRATRNTVAPDESGLLQFVGTGNFILPAEMHPPDDESTYDLDRSLNLDEYTFWNWGVSPYAVYGDHHIVVTPDDDFWRNSVVTPSDIGAALAKRYWDPLEDVWDKQDEENKGNITRKYLDRMVRGEDWLEIAARRTYRFLSALRKDGEPLALGVEVLGLGLHGSGEVKHHGPVDITQARLADSRANEEHIWVHNLAELGFVPTGYLQRYYDRTEIEQLNHVATRTWERVLDWPQAKIKPVPYDQGQAWHDEDK